MFIVSAILSSVTAMGGEHSGGGLAKIASKQQIPDAVELKSIELLRIENRLKYFHSVKVPRRSDAEAFMDAGKVKVESLTTGQELKIVIQNERLPRFIQSLPR